MEFTLVSFLPFPRISKKKKIQTERRSPNTTSQNVSQDSQEIEKGFRTQQDFRRQRDAFHHKIHSTFRQSPYDLCSEQVGDISCAKRNCDTIIEYKAVTERKACAHVTENKKEFGRCGWVAGLPVAAQKAAERDRICSDCRVKAAEKSHRIYNNIGARVAKSREHEQTRDDERRARAEAQSHAAAGMDWYSGPGGHDYGTIPPGNQDALIHGAGMELHSGQEGYGYAHGPAAMFDYPLENIDGILADETAHAGSNNPGEDSSHGSGGGYGQGGYQGYRQ